jgi:hypothetical protein
MAAQMTRAVKGFDRNRQNPPASKPATMTPSVATLLVGLASWYAAAGVVFAVAFVVRGIECVDPLGAGSPWSFRLLIVPGTIVFWPLLLLRWAAGSMAPPVEVNAHRTTPPRKLRVAGTPGGAR